MKLIISSVLFSLMSVSIFGQGEMNNWYFGRNASLDFSSGQPISTSNCAIPSNEGCATVSDIDGNLLFYTNGNRIWDSNHNVMPNGSNLMGGPSSSQSCIVIKKPGANSKYIVFTVDDQGGPNGVRYSEVDMNLNNNLGDVNQVKNQLLSGPVSEKITCVLHENKKAFWIIVKPTSNSEYHSYLYDINGISNTPTVSKGYTYTNNIAEYAGCIKASKTGRYIAAIHTYLDKVEIFNFDTYSGNASSPTTIKLSDNFHPYGVEFSPNEKFLYISGLDTTAPIIQIDITTNDSASILASLTNLNPNGIKGGTLQIGPDSLIYMAQYKSTIIGRINNPNLPGLLSDFNENGIQLIQGQTISGLPNFVNKFWTFNNLDFEAEGYCLGVPIKFIPNIGFADSVKWNFNDPFSNSNSSRKLNPFHTFFSPGSYVVTLIAHSGSKTDTVSHTINIYPSPRVNLGIDTTICFEDSLTLDATWNNASYLWNDSSTYAQKTIKTEGKYWVNLSIDSCSASDSIYVHFRDCSIAIEMPNIFTPNGDGTNDFFCPVALLNLNDLQLLVYNRWGQLVHESAELFPGWDGKNNGQDCSDGVYFWILSYKTTEGNAKTTKGHVTLMR